MTEAGPALSQIQIISSLHKTQFLLLGTRHEGDRNRSASELSRRTYSDCIWGARYRISTLSGYILDDAHASQVVSSQLYHSSSKSPPQLHQTHSVALQVLSSPIVYVATCLLFVSLKLSMPTSNPVNFIPSRLLIQLLVFLSSPALYSFLISVLARKLEAHHIACLTESWVFFHKRIGLPGWRSWELGSTIAQYQVAWSFGMYPDRVTFTRLGK